MDRDGKPWKKHWRLLPFLCDFTIKQVHERIVLLTVKPDLGTESSLSGYDIVIRTLKVYQKNKTENFRFLGRNTSNSFH